MPSETNEIQILKTTETAYTTISLRSDGIIHVHIKDNVVYGLEEQHENLYACIDLVNGVKHPFMYTQGEYVTITKESRENSEKISKISPMYPIAIIVQNLAYKLVAEFFLKFHKPKIPMKIFSNEEKAIEWLLNFPKTN